MGHKNVYIFSISILQIKICLRWIDEKPYDYLLFNHEKKRKIWFLSVGINDHEIIFTIFFVWVDISLVCLMLDVVFFHWCLLSGNKPMMHAKNPVFCNTTISIQEWVSMNQIIMVFFSKKIYLSKLKGKYRWGMKSFVFLAKKKCDVCRICKDDLVCMEFVT